MIRAADRVLDAVVAGFALWTLCCHLTVAGHGTGVQLLWAAATTLVLVAAVLWLRARYGALTRRPDDVASSALPVELAAAQPISVVGLAGAITVIQIWNQQGDPFYFWSNSLAFLVLSSVLLLWKPVAFAGTTQDPRVEARKHAVLWLLALLSAALTAMMRRPNSDDVLYVNIAATFADHPEYVLYARDTLHGDSVPLLAAYSAHSYELLAGALSWLTQVPALHIMHLGFAPLASLLSVLALGRLFRLIEPRRWLWLVAIVISWYVFDGTTDRSIAGHAFARMYQGKSVLLSAGLPLIAAHAIGFSLDVRDARGDRGGVSRPSWRKWGLLCAAVISGIGLSSTGMWLALLVGLTGLFVPLTWTLGFWRTLCWGLTSLSYPFVFALWMRSAAISEGRSTAWQMPRTIAAAGKEALGLRPELTSFGSPHLSHAYLACLLLAWPLARTALARRYLVAYTLGGFAVLMNPFLAGLVATNLTGVLTYSRALWYMPFAAAFAICFAALVSSTQSKLRGAVGAAVTIAALHWFYQGYPKASTLGLLEFPPALKVDPNAYAVAKYLTRKLHDDGAKVLVPYPVALVLPTLQHSPLVVITKPKWFDDDGARYRLLLMVEHKGGALRGRYRNRFLTLLELHGVRGLVLTEAAMQTDGMRESLLQGGFREAKRVAGYHTWLRPRWPPADNAAK